MLCGKRKRVVNRILIVEDDAALRATLAEQIRLEGDFTADEAESASEAEAKLGSADARYDAILLDIGLPEMDGNELAQRLRALPETADAVLIAVTGYGQQHDRETALESGFDHHMVKPVDAVELRSLLAELSVQKSGK